MTIKSLEGVDFNRIVSAFLRAFSDYDVIFSAEDIYEMCKRRGFDPALSFAAFDKDEIVAFTLNGKGSFNGKEMAYDTGTATVKEYRGRGLAAQIFKHSIPFLKDAGITHYILEVLKHNIPAISIYENVGFKITREFNYFSWKEGMMRNEINNSRKQWDVREISLPSQVEVQNFWDFNPSWQNGFESVERSRERFISLAVYADEMLVGYAIFEPASGDITQLAVHPNFRRKGIASYLLSEMEKRNQSGKFKVINTETSCTSITGFLESKGIAPAGQQYEMMKEL